MAGLSVARARALVIITTMVVAVVLLLASAVQATGDPEATAEYRVRTGDTLWAIAAEIAPEGEDVRNLIGRIQSLNDLDGAVIHIGDLLLVPAGPGS